MEKLGSFITGLVTSVIGFIIGLIIAVLLVQSLSIQEPFDNYIVWFLGYLVGILFPLLISFKIKVVKKFYWFGILIGLILIPIFIYLRYVTTPKML